MADVVRYVNYSSSGGDGTTNGTSGATAAYATLAAWQAAEATNLVSAGDTHTAYITGSTSADRAVISGWTTGASNTLTIAGHPQDRHGGDRDGTAKIEHAGTVTPFEGTIELQSAYVTIRDLVIVASPIYGAVGIKFESGATNITIERVIVYANSSSTYSFGISAYGGDTTSVSATLDNVLVFDTHGRGIVLEAAGFSATLSFTCTNCGVFDINDSNGQTSTMGNYIVEGNVDDTLTFSTTNCAGFGSPVAGIWAAYNTQTLSSFSGDYNISDDTTAPGANTIDNATFTTSATPSAGTNYVVVSNTLGSEDYSLRAHPNNSAIKGGTTSGAPTEDIRGMKRDSNANDIGPYAILGYQARNCTIPLKA